MSSSSLRVAPCSHEAAVHAIRRWHYTQRVPVGKLFKLGAWENGRFVGAVVFSRGSCPWLGKKYELGPNEVCELTRVALGEHDAPTSKIVAYATKILRRMCTGLRLVVSYADIDQGHHGGIYQAMGWLYVGAVNVGKRGAFMVHGEKLHPKSVHAMGGTQSLAWVRDNLDPEATEFITEGKHKYLLPLDTAMRDVLKIETEPYPKRTKPNGEAPTDQVGEGGSTPTRALQKAEQ